MPKTTYTHCLRWPIDQLPAMTPVLEAFPELNAYPVLVQYGSGPAGDQLLRFAFFFGDKGSGLRALRDLPQEKVEALRLAGISERDPRHAAVLAWRDVAAVQLVNQVVRLQNSLRYTTWFHMGLGLYNSAEKISAIIGSGLDAPIKRETAPDSFDADPADHFINDEASQKQLVFRKPGSNDMGEDKEMRTYTLRHKLIDEVDRQSKKFEELTNELFLSDEELAAASQEQLLAGAGAVGRRSQDESFIPR